MLADLRELASSLPVPAPTWHAHVELMLQVRDELLAGIDELAALPDGEALVEQLLGEEREPRPGTALAALPAPGGEHPYLGEILAVLEAARLVQAARVAASLNA